MEHGHPSAKNQRKGVRSTHGMTSSTKKLDENAKSSLDCLSDIFTLEYLVARCSVEKRDS